MPRYTGKKFWISGPQPINPVIDGMKVCTKCLISKPVSDFYTKKRIQVVALWPHCKSCHYKQTVANKHKSEEKKEQLRLYYRQYSRDYYMKHGSRRDPQARLAWYKDWYKSNPDKILNSRLKKSHGITLEDFKAMEIEQGGVCAICQHPPKVRRLSVEHDHKVGRVRGLVCFACNKNKVGTNTVDSARRVVTFLESDFDGRLL